MHEIEMFVYIVVGMGILFADASMRSPTRMCDSEGIFLVIKNLFRYFIGKIRYLSYGSDKLKISFIVAYKQTCRIISAVFQPFQSVHQDLLYVITLSLISEDSAHDIQLSR
jgi:hypothetical protein